MGMQAEQAKVEQIVKTALQVSCRNIVFLGQGATSAAWRVAASQNELIVRIIPAGTNRPTTYQSEFTILRLLRQQGCPVPKPITNSAECNLEIDSVLEPWAITNVVEGCAIQKGALPNNAATSIGEVLATMDSLPTSGFGRLQERSDGLVGTELTPREGAKSRWCWAKLWPLTEPTLTEHPITRLAPHLIHRLEQLKLALDKIAESEDVVLSHADLHGEHIFVDEDRLTGLIDFGAAFIGARSWDFASLAFYHGWETAAQAIRGYTTNVDQRKQCSIGAKEAAIALALYKLDKAVADNAPNTKIARIVSFIETTLQK